MMKRLAMAGIASLVISGTLMTAPPAMAAERSAPGAASAAYADQGRYGCGYHRWDECDDGRDHCRYDWRKCGRWHGHPGHWKRGHGHGYGHWKHGHGHWKRGHGYGHGHWKPWHKHYKKYRDYR